PVRAELDVADDAADSREDEDGRARLDIPHPGRAVRATRCHQRPIGAERDAEGKPPLADQRALQLTRRGVPDLDGPVQPRGGDPAGLTPTLTQLPALCPGSVRSRRPVSPSQMAAVPSSLPVASREPSGENCTSQTRAR